MHAKAFRYASLPLGLLASSCGPSNHVSEEVAALRADLTQARADISQLQNRAFMLELDAGRTAFVSCDAEGFSTVRSDVGVFTIKCENAEPYLDGFRLRLRFGNPTAASLNNPSLKVVWGSRSKDETLLGSFPAGSWTLKELILTPASAQDVKQLKVSFDASNISLFPPRGR
jgi:hypothetical protein